MDTDALREFVQELADEDCTYGDDCPSFGTRHGKCLRCKAVDVLTRSNNKKEEKNNED